jgi:hypothetical protein
MQKPHYPNNLWRSFYKTLKVDVLEDFRTQVRDEDADSFGIAVCQIALGCNRAVALIGTTSTTDLATHLGVIRESLEQVATMLGESQSAAFFKEALADIDCHIQHVLGAH